MDLTQKEAPPQFTLPLRQITLMLIVIGLVAAGVWVALPILSAIFYANPWLNGVMVGVFVLGVLACFQQVWQLWGSVRWIEGFAGNRRDRPENAPSLLAPLATLLRSVGKRMQINPTSARSIQDSVAERIDEDREITRYIGNVLIFLGLLGTFYGLATTVPALVETIRALDASGGGDIFARLQSGLESQLGGMGTAFSSSLLGLAGSLVVGLLELFAGQAQNRFYRELEEWMSSITRVGFDSSEEGGTGGLAHFAEQIAEVMENMQMMVGEAEADRARTEERFAAMAGAVERLAAGDGDRASAQLLTRIAEGQETLIRKLEDSGVDGIDAESRMRLRSIDVQLLRILEEMAAGRQETVGDLRADLATLAAAIRDKG